MRGRKQPFGHSDGRAKRFADELADVVTNEFAVLCRIHRRLSNDIDEPKRRDVHDYAAR